VSAGTRRNGARYWIVTSTYGDLEEAEEICNAITDALEAAAIARGDGWNLDVDIIEAEPPAPAIPSEYPEPAP